MDHFKAENSVEDFESPYLEDYLAHNTFNLVEIDGILPLLPNTCEQPHHQQAVVPAPPKFPTSPIGPPDRYPIREPSQFVVQINSSETKKRKYVYSHRLNRIYADNDTCIGFEFNWDHRLYPHPMYIRAAVVFSHEAQAQKRVETCVSHSHAAKSAGKSAVVASNVLLSSRAESKNSSAVFYCGDPESQDSWLSVLVKFHKTSDEPCRHAYKFVCKNSCTSGINRRAIDIIFTLEDEMGTVHGRQAVGARVCACPNRDMRRDEAELPPDPAAPPAPRDPAAPPAAPAPAAKKRRVDAPRPTTTADGLFVMPPLVVVRKKALLLGLEVLLNMEEDEAARPQDPQKADLYKKSIPPLKQYIEDLKKLPPC